MLGEHTEEVLKEIGYTDEQIKAMEEKEAAVQIDTTSFNIWMRKCKEGDKMMEGQFRSLIDIFKTGKRAVSDKTAIIMGERYKDIWGHLS